MKLPLYENMLDRAYMKEIRNTNQTNNKIETKH